MSDIIQLLLYILYNPRINNYNCMLSHANVEKCIVIVASFRHFISFTGDCSYIHLNRDFTSNCTVCKESTVAFIHYYSAVGDTEP